MRYPSISVVFAALNSGTVIEACLKSISTQDYPKKKIEVIVADGGSTDKTVEIARRYGCRVLKNPLKTSESGKAVGVKEAKGELVAFIDSDNILPDKNWFVKMVEPFGDKQIIGSEPIEYTSRPNDPFLTRYFAQLGMNDPLCYFIGNYDRMSVLSGKWTGLKLEAEDRGSYFKGKLDHEPLPTIGANGTVMQRRELIEKGVGDYLFDIDVIVEILRKRKVVYFAKVKTGIVHTYVEDDIFKFFRKQLRRINDMSFHKGKGGRAIDWEKSFFVKVIYFQVLCLLVVPILYQTIKGLVKTRDWVWVLHPVIIYSTWFIYLYGWMKGKISPAESSRDKWRQ